MKSQTVYLTTELLIFDKTSRSFDLITSFNFLLKCFLFQVVEEPAAKEEPVKEEEPEKEEELFKEEPAELFNDEPAPVEEIKLDDEDVAPPVATPRSAPVVTEEVVPVAESEVAAPNAFQYEKAETVKMEAEPEKTFDIVIKVKKVNLYDKKTFIKNRL